MGGGVCHFMNTILCVLYTIYELCHAEESYCKGSHTVDAQGSFLNYTYTKVTNILYAEHSTTI